ncbi:hypothetical protein LOTGIDRAFT_207280 [Lottia gigantea]|uniref:PX domain-containing protein n=1 Tax=Lottia gigantea TaxID=225164 RepID=V4B732_LOTGI|nr:hypothetical protein LOTGIDRAFT_207280 [Lottia gigantea]ESO84344.1 hypothetical protein LOTGIDRAFT_207280 [Lottia gigantea]
MALFEKTSSSKAQIDDTEVLSAYIETAQKTGDHIEYILKVQRGAGKENTWQLTKRYSDFDNLESQLRISNIEFKLPPKKVFGNFEREFIAVRQKGLQDFLDSVLSNHFLSQSLCVKRFLDPKTYSTNFPEVALQHVSMIFRSEPKWDVIEPLVDIGTRIRKHYIMVKPIGQPKIKQILSWSDFGLYQYIGERELTAIMTLLSSIQHPHILTPVFSTSNENGGLVISSYCEKGTLRDYLCKCKPKGHYIKKYSNPKLCSPLDMRAIKLYGKQILETLKFLQEKHIPHGHLHTGNIILDNDVCYLTDIHNSLLGLPSYYRPFYTQYKKIQTVELIDVYCFGHVLYEMTFGTQLNTPSCDNFPPECPAQIRSVLESILTTEACKNGIPALADLFMHPLFSDVGQQVKDKPQLKIPHKLKDVLKTAKSQFEDRLHEEQKKISKIKRLSKAKEFHMSEEEKKKRRKSRKRSSPVPPPPPPPVAAPVPPSPPAVAAAPPPPPPPGPPMRSVSAPAGGNTEGRGALLSSISSFSKGGLKKTKTVDKSGPRI